MSMFDHVVDSVQMSGNVRDTKKGLNMERRADLTCAVDAVGVILSGLISQLLGVMNGYDCYNYSYAVKKYHKLYRCYTHEH